MIAYRVSTIHHDGSMCSRSLLVLAYNIDRHIPRILNPLGFLIAFKGVQRKKPKGEEIKQNKTAWNICLYSLEKICGFSGSPGSYGCSHWGAIAKGSGGGASRSDSHLQSSTWLWAWFSLARSQQLSDHANHRVMLFLAPKGSWGQWLLLHFYLAMIFAYFFFGEL